MAYWKLIAAAALVLPFGAAVAGDAERGSEIFAAHCAGCHQIGGHAWGPDLQGVVGRVTGTAEGYEHYSEVFQGLAEEGHAWDAEALRSFLAGPGAYAPGTSMGFPGLGDNTEIADVIAYLEAQEQ